MDNIENNEDSIKKETENLKDDIKKSEKRLEEIQAECNHPESKIKNISNGGGEIAKWRLVCTTCGLVTGHPSPSALDEFMHK